MATADESGHPGHSLGGGLTDWQFEADLLADGRALLERLCDRIRTRHLYPAGPNLALLLEAIRQGRRYVVIGPHMFVALAADLRERLTGSRDMRSASRHLSLRQGLRQRLQEPAQRRPQRA